MCTPAREPPIVAPVRCAALSPAPPRAAVTSRSARLRATVVAPNKCVSRATLVPVELRAWSAGTRRSIRASEGATTTAARHSPSAAAPCEKVLRCQPRRPWDPVGHRTGLLGCVRSVALDRRSASGRDSEASRVRVALRCYATQGVAASTGQSSVADPSERTSDHICRSRSCSRTRSCSTPARRPSDVSAARLALRPRTAGDRGSPVDSHNDPLLVVHHGGGKRLPSPQVWTLRRPRCVDSAPSGSPRAASM
jgi:hypothetical protein